MFNDKSNFTNLFLDKILIYCKVFFNMLDCIYSIYMTLYPQHIVVLWI